MYQSYFSKLISVNPNELFLSVFKDVQIYLKSIETELQIFRSIFSEIQSLNFEYTKLKLLESMSYLGLQNIKIEKILKEKKVSFLVVENEKVIKEVNEEFQSLLDSFVFVFLTFLQRKFKIGQQFLTFIQNYLPENFTNSVVFFKFFEDFRQKLKRWSEIDDKIINLKSIFAEINLISTNSINPQKFNSLFKVISNLSSRITDNLIILTAKVRKLHSEYSLEILDKLQLNNFSHTEMQVLLDKTVTSGSFEDIKEGFILINKINALNVHFLENETEKKELQNLIKFSNFDTKLFDAEIEKNKDFKKIIMNIFNTD